MPVVSIAIQALAILVSSRFLWRKLRQFIVISPLDNLPGPEPDSWLGDLPRIYDPNGWDFHNDITAKYGRILKFKALFGENQLYISDPTALHHIVVKDQYIYEETSAFIESNRLTFGRGLLGTLGDEHKKQRKMLNPVFSIAHMREMVPTFYAIGHQVTVLPCFYGLGGTLTDINKLRDSIADRVKDGPREMNMLSWMTRTALEMIGQGGLGYSFDSLTQDDDAAHPFAKAIKAFLPAMQKMRFARHYLLGRLSQVGTPRLRRLVVDLVPWKPLHELRDVVDVLHNTSVEIFESKKAALLAGNEIVEAQISGGKDIMSILMKANIDASKDDRLSDSELIGQMSTMIFAATDTTSSALSRILWLLASHQDVQEKLRLELREATKEGDLSYDEINSLPYLDAVCRETLRLYPPIPLVQRTTRQDVLLPVSRPLRGVDGSEMSQIHVPNKTTVLISIMACNRDPDIWGADSFEWKPERWIEPLHESVASAHIPGIYSNLMTFLGGGRACIGFKFSQLEIKVVLSLLVESFKFSLSDKEIFWQLTGVVAPAVHNEAVRSQLPLNVEMAK